MKSDIALYYYNKSLDIFKKIGDSVGVSSIYNNIRIVYKLNNQDSLALLFYHKALKIHKELGNSSSIGLVLMNIGIIHLRDNDLISAKKYFLEAYEYLEERKHKPELSNISCNLGRTYVLLNQYDSALIYIKECDSQVIDTDYDGLKSYNAMSFADYYFFQGKFDSARYYLLDCISILEDSFDKRLSEQITKMEKRIDFEQSLKEHEYELIEKNKSIKINKLQKLILFILLIAFLSIGYILFRKKRNEIKYSNEVLYSKNNELVNFAIYILQKNDLIHGFREQLIQIQKKIKTEDNKNAIKEIIDSVIFKIAISKDVDEFREKLREISKDFNNKLEQKFPNLIDKEKQLATLLRLNLSSKQIAVILNSSAESIDARRYRLRKKIMLPADENLVDFLNEI